MNFGGLNILAGLIAGLDILRAAGQRTGCFHWQFSSSSLAAIPTSASVDSKVQSPNWCSQEVRQCLFWLTEFSRFLATNRNVSNFSLKSIYDPN